MHGSRKARYGGTEKNTNLREKKVICGKEKVDGDVL
jgi:hypothetical protein